MKSKQDLTVGNINKKLWVFAIPLMLGNVMQQFYNLVDTWVVGKYIGDNALAAVGSSYSLMTFLTSVILGLCLGSSAFFSITFGEKNIKRLKNGMFISFVMIGIFSLILTFASFYLCGRIMKILQVPYDIQGIMSEYLKWIFVGIFATFLYNYFSNLLRGIGNSVIPLAFLCVSVILNIGLDLYFVLVLKQGIRGAAIATVISQSFSAIFVLYFLTRRSELKMHFIRKNELSECMGYAKNIVSLGTAGFVMQITNSLVTICCNNVLSVTGGDIYISVMTIVSSIRQLVETPIYAINEGSSPILSYNYGAGRASKVKKAIVVMALMIFGYTAVVWSIIIFAPESLIKIFSSDADLLSDTVEALKLYFAAFIFMDLQYIGQTVFKSLNKKKQAIFFSLLRKVFIVVPLTYIMPYALNMGTSGVFMAEPVSNVIGGGICFVTMLCTVLPELKRMEKE